MDIKVAVGDLGESDVVQGRVNVSMFWVLLFSEVSVSKLFVLQVVVAVIAAIVDLPPSDITARMLTILSPNMFVRKRKTYAYRLAYLVLRTFSRKDLRTSGKARSER